jgi:hypothetical protein
MFVQKGISGAGRNPLGLQMQVLESVGSSTPAEIYDVVDFRAEFPATGYDCQRLVTLTEPGDITVNRETGDITIPITPDTFNDVEVKDFAERRGRMSVGHTKTDGTRRLLMSGDIFLKDTLYVTNK